MNLIEKVDKLVNDFLQNKTDIYLLQIKISAQDDIKVVLDGDRPLSIKDCLEASRVIEFGLDKDEHNFSLEVTSPGIDEPLINPRQYRKNIGRELDILLTNDEKINGKLLYTNDEVICLLIKYKMAKQVGKGKKMVEEEKEIPYTDIKKATVIIKF